MSLTFADFAQFYADSGLSPDQQHDDFEVHACFMECLVRFFWRDDTVPNGLGISVDSDTISRLGAIGSDASLPFTFNDAASGRAAGKTDT